MPPDTPISDSLATPDLASADPSPGTGQEAAPWLQTEASPASIPGFPDVRLPVFLDGTGRHCQILLDLEGHIVTWNPEARRLYGYSHEEIRGSHVSRLCPEGQDAPQHLETLFGRAAAQGRSEEETWQIRKDSTRFRATQVFTALQGPDRALRGYALSVLDLTRKSRAGERLRRVSRAAHALFWEALVEDRGGERLHWQLSIADEQEAQQFLPLEVPDGWSYAKAWFFSRLDPDRDLSDLYGTARIRAGESYSQEFRCRRKDGEVRWLHEEVEIEALGPGVWRAVGVCLDVTERKAAEAALEERERRLEQVLSGAGCLLWEGMVLRQGERLEWHLRMCHPEAAQRFLPLETGAGRTYEQALHQSKPEEDRRRTARVAETAVRTGAPGYQQEFRCVQRDGRVRWLWEDVRIEPAGPDTWRLVGVSLDITGRKRAEERDAAFLRLGERLNGAVSSEEAARTVLEIADELLGWNACWLALRHPEEDLLRFTLLMDEVEGRRTELPSPGPVLPFSPLAERALREGAFRYERDPEEPIPVERRFGDVKRATRSVLVVPIRHRESVLGVLSIQSYTPGAYDANDLRTLQALADYCASALERTRAEAARVRLEEELRQSQKMEAVGRLAGGVAHDFNNMLAVINGYSALLLQSLSPESPLHESLSQINQAGERAAGLTRQLLAFSRKQMMRPRSVDICELLENLQRMLQRLIGEDIELVLECPARLGHIHADPGQVEQVLMNLAVNSRDAMPEGGELRLRAEAVQLQAGALPEAPHLSPGEYVCLTVTDTGFGIAPNTLARIWEPFFTTKEAGKGTGLGLATVYGIIQQSGGAITVRSEVGKGTEFRVYFPRGEAEETRATVEPLAELRGTETILVVEDEEQVRRLMVHTLRSFGYQVLEAASGAQALSMAASRENAPLDLLLTDVVMPGGLNGRELADSLRDMRPGLRILHMSGYTDDEVMRRGIFEGETPFIQKPFLPLALLKKVREVLGRT